MRKLLLICLLTLVFVTAKAQDTIIFRDTNEVQAKITAIDPDTVTYKRWDNMEGPTYTINKSDIFYIKYQNGQKDVFETAQYRSHNANTNPIKFQGYVNLGAITDFYYAGPTLDVNFGTRIYDYFYVGFETGFHSLIMHEAYIPFGINLKGYLTRNTTAVPYVNISLGGFAGVADMGSEMGFYCQIGAGIDIKRFSIGLGYSGLVDLHTESMMYVKLGVRFGKK